MPVVVLGLICLIVAAALGVVNHFTSQEIEKQMLIKANAGKIEVLPGLDITTMVETVPEEGKYPSEVKKISKFDVGYVIETEVKGNAAGMVVLVGIDNDGKITGVKVLANAETPSFWSSVSSVVTGKDGKYNGQTPDTLAPEIVSGATNSSNGVYSAVKATNNMRIACTRSGVSHSKAWDMINRLERSLGYSVVERQRGGKAGGSTRLTPQGADFLAAYQEFEQAVHHFTQNEFKKRFILTKIIE